MNEEEARRKLGEYLASLRGDIGYHPPDSWTSDELEVRQLPNGDWLAARPEFPADGIVLKCDGAPIPFFGALGKLVPLLGLPISRELLLGSAQVGRYQVYQRWLAVWETFGPDRDLGYPVANWEFAAQRAKKCQALVAFFDLRGFTKWSGSGVDAEQIQAVVETLERSFQDAFSREWCQRLFAKGTGDGFMLVCEAERYAVGGARTDSGFQLGHAEAFCRACAETVTNAKERLPTELAVGCGITTGEVTQLYLLGRFDYIGSSVNEASKIQALAYDELCISPKVLEYLGADGIRLEGKMLPDKGMRVDPMDLLSK